MPGNTSTGSHGFYQLSTLLILAVSRILVITDHRKPCTPYERYFSSSWRLLSFLPCDLVNKKENLSLEHDFSLIKINNEYQIRIPNYMKKTEELHDEASLQFQNVFKETYLIIIDEPKDEFISVFNMLGEYDSTLSVVENYRNIQLRFISENITSPEISEPTARKINGLDAELVELDGRVEGVIYKVSYFLAFFEGDENVYMAMAWTISTRKDRFQDTFEKAFGTFQLI